MGVQEVQGFSRRRGAMAATDVELVPWPDAEERRQQLAALGRPRLLLVGAASPPPDVASTLEDWIRVPASERDLAARIERLRELAARWLAPTPPTVDDDGLVAIGDRWVALSPVQAAVARLLVANVQRVVARAELEDAAGVDHGRRLDTIVHRLRQRVEPFGWTVIGVRGRGYVLAPLDDDDSVR